MQRGRFVATAAIALLIAGGTGADALAEPGPNGHNNFDLCTAYFAGSEKGQEQKHKAPPFQALEAAAEAVDQTVAEWCAANAPHPGGK